jgi:hypothetical protein
LLWGVAVTVSGSEVGARVLVEEAGVVAVGAEVSVARDTDPQAITASMIARQDVIRALWNIKFMAPLRTSGCCPWNWVEDREVGRCSGIGETISNFRDNN